MVRIGSIFDFFQAESRIALFRAQIFPVGVQGLSFLTSFSHRDGKDTACPGQRLYVEFSTWDNWHKECEN